MWKRVLKRIDMTSRSIFTLIEPGSCFAGFLAELVFASDRALMFSGRRSGDNRPEAQLVLSALNFGALPMGNGLSRLATRFLGEPEESGACREIRSKSRFLADDAERLGLVTAAYDEVDWDEEVRLMLEERASFSADALTGLEANLRFAGPETMETKIFGRLTAWQNWIFQRPNAVGDTAPSNPTAPANAPISTRNGCSFGCHSGASRSGDPEPMNTGRGIWVNTRAIGFSLARE